MSSVLLHGTCVEINGKAVLITGQSGFGKSSVALQLIDRGAMLVADDQTLISFIDGMLVALPPPTIRGLLEVRGVGLISYPYQEKSPLFLSVEICDDESYERLPEPLFIEYHECEVPLLKLKRGDPMSAIKIELKLSKGDGSHD